MTPIEKLLDMKENQLLEKFVKNTLIL